MFSSLSSFESGSLLKSFPLQGHSTPLSFSLPSVLHSLRKTPALNQLTVCLPRVCVSAAECCWRKVPQPRNWFLAASKFITSTLSWLFSTASSSPKCCSCAPPFSLFKVTYLLFISSLPPHLPQLTFLLHCSLGTGNRLSAEPDSRWPSLHIPFLLLLFLRKGPLLSEFSPSTCSFKDFTPPNIPAFSSIINFFLNQSV